MTLTHWRNQVICPAELPTFQICPIAPSGCWYACFSNHWFSSNWKLYLKVLWGQVAQGTHRREGCVFHGYLQKTSNTKVTHQEWCSDWRLPGFVCRECMLLLCVLLCCLATVLMSPNIHHNGFNHKWTPFLNLFLTHQNTWHWITNALEIFLEALASRNSVQ